MKNIIYTILFILIPLSARAEYPESYLSRSDLPNGYQYLPAPPSETEAVFFCDWNRYEWGKTLRSSQRGQMARSDADSSPEAIAKAFSIPLGINISQSQTPVLYALVGRTVQTLHISLRSAKKSFSRTRPYVYFREPTLIPDAESAHSPNASYPSGHAAIGWGVALVLAEIAPDMQNALFKRGWEYGQSRVIAGYHYQSDVEAGRLAASAAIARLHADKAFAVHLAQAKEEFAARKSKRAEKT